MADISGLKRLSGSKYYWEKFQVYNNRLIHFIWWKRFWRAQGLIFIFNKSTTTVWNICFSCLAQIVASWYLSFHAEAQEKNLRWHVQVHLSLPVCPVDMSLVTISTFSLKKEIKMFDTNRIMQTVHSDFTSQLEPMILFHNQKT